MFKGDQINHRIYSINWVVYRRFDDLNRYKNQEETKIQINKKRVKSISLFFQGSSSPSYNIYLTFGFLLI